MRKPLPSPQPFRIALTGVAIVTAILVGWLFVEKQALTAKYTSFWGWEFEVLGGVALGAIAGLVLLFFWLRMGLIMFLISTPVAFVMLIVIGMPWFLIALVPLLVAAVIIPLRPQMRRLR